MTSTKEIGGKSCESRESIQLMELEYKVQCDTGEKGSVFSNFKRAIIDMTQSVGECCPVCTLTLAQAQSLVDPIWPSDDLATCTPTVHATSLHVMRIFENFVLKIAVYAQSLVCDIPSRPELLQESGNFDDKARCLSKKSCSFLSSGYYLLSLVPLIFKLSKVREREREREREKESQRASTSIFIISKAYQRFCTY